MTEQRRSEAQQINEEIQALNGAIFDGPYQEHFKRVGFSEEQTGREIKEMVRTYINSVAHPLPDRIRFWALNRTCFIDRETMGIGGMAVDDRIASDSDRLWFKFREGTVRAIAGERYNH